MDLTAVAHVLHTHGLRLLPGSFSVPVSLLAELPDASVAHFTARGTTIRLAVYPSQALTSVAIPTECDCGEHHDPVGPRRPVLGAHAMPTAVRQIDGGSAFGWRGHEAGLLRLAGALPYFFELLDRITETGSGPVAPTRELVAVG